jgi:F-type H+-transporting ATPase subunit delta
VHVSSKAMRYSRAISRVATAKGIEDQVLSELGGIAEFLGERPVARLILESPAASSQSQGDLLRAIGGAHEFSEVTRNTLNLLVGDGRFQLFAEVVEGLAEQIRRRKGVVRASVTSAKPLSAEQLASLKKAVGKIANARDVELVVDEDPELIAGAVTRIGSVVYDGSLATALTRLREQLISE